MALRSCECLLRIEGVLEGVAPPTELVRGQNISAAVGAVEVYRNIRVASYVNGRILTYLLGGSRPYQLT